ncbi:hypothetical protein K501DRAFT_282497 [Backusella circina FSU 941]|nr:hypothetical protein K501DRAFT_282497 [Backusella circina FSU 941]
MSINDHDIPQVFEIDQALLCATAQENIYTVTASAYNDILNSYRHFPLSNDILFPWLHGVDGHSYQQNLFFGVRRCLAPQHRGIMTIHADDNEKTRSRLVESVLSAEVIVSENQFLDQSQSEKGINLRNFQNQVSRYATLCDIFVYGQHAQQVTEAIAKAQLDLHKLRLTQIEQTKKNAGARAVVNANKILYRAIIIKDDFAVFERDFPHLVMYDSTGLNTGNYHPFNEIELNEMREMSAASEITRNVWAGNTQDAPVTVQEFGQGNDSSEEEDFNDDHDNPHGFSICIEAHDLADMPLPSTLTLARETLNELGDGKIPSEIIHFDMYATGVPNEKNAFNIFFTRLYQLLQFMEDQSERGRRVLIHCSDGYTETSLLILSWIMYRCKLHLPDAYLYLQKSRSFFVYAADLSTLRQIEGKIFNGTSIIEPSPKRRKSELCDDTIKRLNIRSNTILDVEMTENGRLLHDDAYINAVSNNNDINETIPSNIYKQLYLEPTDEDLKLYPWFYSPRFEGSFPSRILPFLYLGNLNHATNHDMLKTLNITHIVSVGENADVVTKGFKVLFLDNLYDDGIDPIRGRLDAVMAFVDDARAQGSQCLVHCRVGVSRSAAVTICYVMRHLKYTLTQAYLFVRARRLNVIIQPNLKFMYEMLQLEQRQSGLFSITWPILCKEIASINNSYKDN